MTEKTKKKFTVQLLKTAVQGQGESKLTFACNHDSLMEVSRLLEIGAPINFWITGAEKDKISGSIYSANSNVNGRVPHKFVLEVPEVEVIKSGELSTLAGKELELNIEIV